MRERRMAAGRRDPNGGGFLRGRTIRPPAPIHLLLSESALYRPTARNLPTWCSGWAVKRETTSDPDAVTCPRCRDAFAEHGAAK